MKTGALRSGRAAGLAIALFALVALAATFGAGAVHAVSSPGLPAQVVSITRPASLNTYATDDYSKKKTGTTTWRVVQGTGNCCENYLAATKKGRLLDFGGSFINYTDDRGLTWHQVQPLTPLVNGEGTIVVNPNGDVDAIGWDPYSGDHLQAFKYTAATGAWTYAEQPLHQPFYDREWITVLPGPFVVNGQTVVPYLTFVKGGYPWKDPAFYSTDGLTYADASSMFVDETLGTPVESYLETTPSSAFDWMQPNTGSGMTPLGAGAALASGEFTTDWGLLDPRSLSWRTFTYPGGVQPKGLHQVDSKGRIDNVVPHGDGFDYRITADGGRTWRSASVALPSGDTIDQIDFRANAALGVGAVAVHALQPNGNDQDYAYKFGISTTQPVLQRRYTVGKGDTGSAAGVGNSVRMDFQSIAILPDGRLALSFLDSTTHYPSPTTGADQTRPALAIEQTSSFR